jgi:putative redox protein
VAEAAPATPPVLAALEWRGGNRFLARTGDVELTLDSPPAQGAPTPVQALVIALAGCMAMDVAVVMNRSRLPLRALRVEAVGLRAQADPKRLLKLELRFFVTGEIPPDRIERALALSREKYCSVWHSLREDVELTTGYEILG